MSSMKDIIKDRLIKMIMVSKVYTPKEVAEILKTSERTVQEMFRSRKLKGIKVGKSWRISDEELQFFIDNPK